MPLSHLFHIFLVYQKQCSFSSQIYLCDLINISTFYPLILEMFSNDVGYHGNAIKNTPKYIQININFYNDVTKGFIMIWIWFVSDI